MSRTPGASCLIDVRTAAVCQSQAITRDPCAPPGTQPVPRGNYLDNCQPPACGYDRGKDLISCAGASIIVATCLGIMHSFACYIPSAALKYEAGYLEQSLIAAITYMIILITACLSYFIVEYAGHKLTAIFGMTLVFVGVLIDSQAFHISTLFIGHFLFGIGAGMAYAASVTLPSDLFRVKIILALTIVDVGGSVGTIMFTWIGFKLVDIIGFQFTKILVAILALFFTIAVHTFPKTRLFYARDCINATSDKGEDTSAAVRQCVYNATIGDPNQNQPDCDGEGDSWLCVCVCDMRMAGDRSFMLWAILVMLATMNFQLPYLYMISFAETVGADLSAWYITVYCVGSIVTRVVFIRAMNYKFYFNRTLFQGSVLFSGIMWIIICWTDTFGWILVCCLVMGLLEGIICVVISRLTLGTVPRRWFGCAWGTCIVCHAIGMCLVTVFTAVIAQKTLHYYVPFITTGIVQIIAAFLGFLLPNEEVVEGQGNGVNAVTTTQTTTISKYKTTFPSGPTGARVDLDYMRTTYGLSGIGCYDRGPRISSRKIIDYKCQCPICTKMGGIPGCTPGLDATPGVSGSATGTGSC